MACSKAYKAIRRFSEDVDLTYDIRELAHDLVGENDEALPKTRSEEKRWTSEVRKRLPVWLDETVSPLIVDAINAQSLPATVRIDSDKLFIDYEAVGGGSGYVAPSVMLEFGARSTGEPASVRDVSCDGAGLVDDIEFPTAKPRVMHAERTFWEKATAIHVFCLQERLRGERFSRHWHDIVRLDDIGIANSAIAARDLTNRWRNTNPCFSPRKRPIERRSTMKRPWTVGCGLLLPAKEGQLSNRTTPGCLKTAFFSMRPRLSTNSSLDARKFKIRPMLAAD